MQPAVERTGRLDRELEQLLQDLPRACEIAAVDAREAELQQGALIRLGRASGRGLPRDPRLEQRLVEALAGEEAGDAELARGGGEHEVRLGRRPRLDGELGVAERGTVVPADAAEARERRMCGRDDVGGVGCLGQGPLLVGDRLGHRHRVHLRPEPAEPDQGAGAVRAGRQRFREVLEQWQHVVAALARRLVEVGCLQQASSRCGDVALRREGGGALRKHGGGLGGTAAVDPAGRRLELHRDRLARRLRPMTEVERALVGIVDRIGQCEVGCASLLARVHVEQRRREQRVRERHAPGANDDHAGRAQLVQALHVDAWLEPPERGRAQAGRPRRSREALESRAQHGREALGNGELRRPRPRRARARSTGFPPRAARGGRAVAG